MAGQIEIELKNADICQREELVLQDVSFTIAQGEFVYCVGRVGTGKSSLIKTMNAEIPLGSGTGSVAGFPLHALKPRDIPMLRRKLGVVFQDFRLLFDRNVKENLEFVLKATGWKQPKSIQERIRRVLEMVDKEKNIVKMPHRLSGGEQQRVVIARAILNDPSVILADEPTGNLDPESSEQILFLLQELNRAGKTIVMATHDYALIAGHKRRTLICENRRVADVSDAGEQLDFGVLF